jgi:imidazolonepropionase-like amidohydrolase
MKYQNSEFKLRSQIETPFQTLYSATYKNAELLNMKNKLGIIKPEAYADIIVLEENPLENINVLTNPEKNIKLIIKNGSIVLNRLDSK